MLQRLLTRLLNTGKRQPRRVQPSLEALEERFLPAGGVDGFLWDPPHPDTDVRASNPFNWDLNEKIQQPGSAYVPGQIPGQVTFDPGATRALSGNGASKITWDYSVQVPAIFVGGSTPYTGTQTIGTGVSVTAGTINETSTSQLNVVFNGSNASNSLLNINNGTTELNYFNFTSGFGGTGFGDFVIGDQATLMLDCPYSGSYYNTQVPIAVYGSMWILNAANGSWQPVTLQTTNANLPAQILVGSGGILTCQDGNQVSEVFVQGDGAGSIAQNSEEIYVYSGGEADFFVGNQAGNGTQGSLCRVPLSNYGHVVIRGLAASGSAMSFYGKAVEKPYSVVNAGNYRSLDLNDNVILWADQGLYNGNTASLYTDATQNTVSGGSGGIVIDTGSFVRWQNQPGQYSTLTFVGNVTLNGTLKPAIDGDGTNNWDFDQLSVVGNITFGAGATISPTIYNSLAGNGSILYAVLGWSGTETNVNNVQCDNPDFYLSIGSHDIYLAY